MPPPRVRPATPVVEINPPVLARPCAAVDASKSAQVAPGSTLAVRAVASTVTPRMRDRSMTTPSSQTQNPATLCPPARTDSGQPAVRARLIAATMSSAEWHCAIKAGRASTMPFHTARAVS